MGLEIDDVKPEFEMLTPLFREMIICHWWGMTHSEFCNLSVEDKMKMLFYEEMTRRREIHFQKQQADKIRQEKAKQMTQPRIRRR